MLRSSRQVLSKPVSKQSRHTGFALGAGKGRRYENQSHRAYAQGGFGTGTYTTAKDRRFKTPMFIEPFEPHKPENMPMTNTTKSLSHEWKPFALNDGGVLFLHPTRDQIMAWNQKVMLKERETTGMTTRDHDIEAKTQTLMADNTLEHISLAAYRREHLTRLISKHMGMKKMTSAYPSKVEEMAA